MISYSKSMLKKLIQKLFGAKREKSAEAEKEENEWVPVDVKSPEELCDVNPDTQSPDAIKQHLAVLYKRHNSAVSSLNPQLRDEAKQMLEAIAECRARYVDDTKS